MHSIATSLLTLFSLANFFSAGELQCRAWPLCLAPHEAPLSSIQSTHCGQRGTTHAPLIIAHDDVRSAPQSSFLLAPSSIRRPPQSTATDASTAASIRLPHPRHNAPARPLPPSFNFPLRLSSTVPTAAAAAAAAASQPDALGSDAASRCCPKATARAAECSTLFRWSSSLCCYPVSPTNYVAHARKQLTC